MNPKVHGKAFFATFRKQVPWLYPEQAYKEMFIEQVPADITPDDEDLEYVHLKLSSAIRLPIDTQGRVVLPERLLDRAELDKEVTLIGAGDHLELWSAKRWQDRQDDLFGRNSDIEKRQKENREKRTQ
jgi:MraZ protein